MLDEIGVSFRLRHPGYLAGTTMQHPYVFKWNGRKLSVSYQPAESNSGLFGGNSNWRGPIWFPVNYLLIESLQKFHHYYGDDFKMECPTGSGNFITIDQVASEIVAPSDQDIPQERTRQVRPVSRRYPRLQKNDPHFRDNMLFYEYFHGDTGRGVGASHQTGWTGLGRQAHCSRASARSEPTTRSHTEN